MHKNSAYIAFLLALGDLLALLIAFLAAYLARFGNNWVTINHFLVFLFGIAIIYLLVGGAFKLFEKFFFQEKWARLGLWLRVMLVFMVLVIAFNGLLKTYFSRLLLAGLFVGMGVLQVAWRLLLGRLIALGYIASQHKRKVWIATNQSIADFIKVFEQFKLIDVVLTGYFGKPIVSKYTHLGDVSALLPALANQHLCNNVDEIYCSLNTLSVQEIHKLINIADNNLIKIYFIPEQNGIPFRKLNLDFLGTMPVFSVRNLAINEPFNRFVKRVFDLIFACLVILLILSWLTPILALLIKLESKGPVFFKQLRSGENNKLFWCYKFRSMAQNAEAHAKQATINDPRITKLGRFLRSSSIDELPQFFNVLLGNMSVIGPRPHMVSHTETYSKIINKFMVRHLVKPGITGLSQAMGLRGETKERNAMKHRVKVDIFYIENWSIWLDLRILLMTISSIFKPNNNAR